MTTVGSVPGATVTRAAAGALKPVAAANFTVCAPLTRTLAPAGYFTVSESSDQVAVGAPRAFTVKMPSASPVSV